MFKQALILGMVMALMIASGAVAGEKTIVLQPEEVQTRYMDLETVPLDLRIVVDLEGYQAQFIDLETVVVQAAGYIDLSSAAISTDTGHVSLQ